MKTLRITRMAAGHVRWQAGNVTERRQRHRHRHESGSDHFQDGPWIRIFVLIVLRIKTLTHTAGGRRKTERAKRFKAVFGLLHAFNEHRVYFDFFDASAFFDDAELSWIWVALAG